MRTLGVLFLLALSVMADAQSRTSETIEVSIVNLDVVVTDKQGNRVKGLTAADFEVREAGKVQPITNFAEYGPAITDAKASVDVAAEPGEPVVQRRPRTIILFVDWSRLAPFQSKQIFDSLRRLVSETVEPRDRATIVSWDGSGVRVRQQFTDDVEKLHAVLDVLEVEQVNGPRDLADQVRREQAASDQDAMVMETGAGMPPVHVLEAAMRDRLSIAQKTDVLEALMNSVSGVEGRKILIMATRRFGKFAGAEFFPGGEVPNERRQELSTAQYRDRLVRTANANNVSLYPIYPIGLKWAGVSDVEMTLDIDKQENNVLFNEANALTELAEDTGGLMAWGAGNIAEMLPRVADDLETFYSLGYRAPSSGKDRVRKIEVRARNPAYQVRTRTQFVEKSDETRVKDRMIANLYQSLEESKIPFDVEVGELRKSGRKRWELPLKIRIPIGALTMLPEGEEEVGEFTVYVVTGAQIGVMSDVQHKSQPFRIPKADLARAKASHFTFDFAVQVDEKVDRIAVGVLDETAKELGVKSIAMPKSVAAR